VEEYSSPHSSPHPEVGGHIALKTHVSSLKDEAYGQSDARRSHKGGDVGLVGFSRWTIRVCVWAQDVHEVVDAVKPVLFPKALQIIQTSMFDAYRTAILVFWNEMNSILHNGLTEADLMWRLCFCVSLFRALRN
jgi:hypothetical protein